MIEREAEEENQNIQVSQANDELLIDDLEDFIESFERSDSRNESSAENVSEFTESIIGSFSDIEIVEIVKDNKQSKQNKIKNEHGNVLDLSMPREVVALVDLL